MGVAAAGLRSPAVRLRDSREAHRVDIGWILLGLVGWTLGLLFTLVLMRMSGDQDRAARREEKRVDPYSDVTITRSGTG